MSAALELAAISSGYGQQHVLSGLSLNVPPNEVVALLGPSGCGKSTVVRLILGFLAPVAGSIRIDGRLVSRHGQVLVPPEQRGLAVVFQDLALWPHLSVGANVTFVLEALGLTRSQRHRRAHEVLAEVGLAGRAASYPGELSGGERQRVAIARALASEPRLILLDEPLANLDVHLKRSLLATFRQLFQARRSTVLYVTHDLREAAVLADRIAVLERGSIVQQGTLDELRLNPATAFVHSLVADLDWNGAG